VHLALLRLILALRSRDAKASTGIADLALNPSPGFDNSRHADQGDLAANPTVGRANGRLLMPMSGHFVLPDRRETRCGWPASDV
jgi:hypothetical protein